MGNKLADQFMELFESSDSIEVDGNFIRHYDDTVHSTSGDPDEDVIRLDYNCDGDDSDVIITAGDLEEIKLSEEGGKWHVAGYVIEFYNVDRIDTKPV